MAEWRNGRRWGFKIPCLFRTCGFESRLGYNLCLKPRKKRGFLFEMIKMNIKEIKTEAEYDEALAVIEELLQIGEENMSEKQLEELERVSIAVAKYEEEHYPIELPDPIEAIRFRMDQDGLTYKDLQKYIGSSSKVSEVMNRKRPLSMTMIKALHEGLGISLEVLTQDTTNVDPGSNQFLANYPFNEMFKRNYFPWFRGTLPEAKKQAETLMCQLLDPLTRNSLYFCRKTDKNTTSEAALTAWYCRVCNRLEPVEIPLFQKDVLTDDFIRSVVRLSFYEQGPALVGEHLRRFGIHFITEPHLPKTYLDGAAWLLSTGNPVVALTLRHDRLDNFWFTLMHELAHVKLHLTDGKTQFFDDFDDDSHSADQMEQEANAAAAEWLIPAKVWNTAKRKLLNNATPADVIALANQLQISPAIIAARIRQEKEDFTLFSDLIGKVKQELV